jgi:acyl-CoA synthetase (AMP-forming)/AMP-acid ligase II
MMADHPPPVREHYISNSEASLVVTTTEYADSLQDLAVKAGAQLLVLDEALRVLAMKAAPKSTLLPAKPEPSPWDEDQPLEGGLDPQFYNDNDAMIIYTSGTTGPPKGILRRKWCRSGGNVHDIWSGRILYRLYHFLKMLFWRLSIWKNNATRLIGTCDRVFKLCRQYHRRQFHWIPTKSSK